MKKVKLFSTSTWKLLENEMNLFLKVNPKIFINECQMSTAHTERTSEYLCMLIYYEKEG